jgi:hypothetical protein
MVTSHLIFPLTTATGIYENYPDIFFVPRSTTDEFMKNAIHSRESGAVPILLYCKV